jgi:uncharacterized protein YegP (UPF0339 family)
VLQRDLAETDAGDLDLARRVQTLDDSDGDFELYEDTGGEYRWRLRHRNGSILAESGDSYRGRDAVFDAIERVKRQAPGAEIEE